MPIMYLANYSPIAQIVEGEYPIIQSAIAVVVSISLGALSYSKIEKKYRDKGRADHSNLKITAIPLVLTLVLPAILFVCLDRSITFPLKNSGLPVPAETLPWNWDKECQFHSFSSDISRDPCKYGNHNSEKSILLIGDSHAASTSRAIITLGNMNDMDTFVFTFTGCGFVLSNKDFNPSNSYPYLTADCVRHNQKILKFVQKSKPTVVIYMHRSSSIVVSPNNSKSRAQYNNTVVENLQTLMKENSQVIHIGSTPELMPTVTRVQDWLNSKSKFSDIPFEDNSFWENNEVTDYYLNTLNIFCPERFAGIILLKVGYFTTQTTCLKLAEIVSYQS